MVKWGILGTGKIARQFAEDFRFVKDAELVAVGSRTEVSARQFAETHQIKTYHSSYEQLTLNPDIDVIYISTPHTLHRENTLLCLENNKSVLCEKPIGINVHELDELTQLAREKQLFLMEAMWTYFLPPLQRAKAWVAEGAIGEINMIKANFGFKANYDPQSRLFNPDLAGGALLDVGIYPIALSLLFSNAPIEDVQVMSSKAPTNVDITDIYQLRFSDGILADLSCSVGHSMLNDGFIYGTKGHIHIPNFWKARKAILTQYDGSEPVIFEDSRESIGYNFEADEVTRSVLAGKMESEVVPLSKSREFLSLMDKIRNDIGLVYPSEKSA
ncbi:Gfo/Idh/MocA family oxidoreductase [Fulvivirga sp. M361]|uniref:Gfo/Idh/MocA family protein n=1 Tax=Fulvivirga sp. M361 TaxID=2594266 RepID=UPI00117A3AE3|nr:Gfo/Idh/MocA family oxidoreductase [Fulvivirga sp. M361]TRX56022.1 Gfo/Idh/MocA family oxidoreductase [Fulvivirga sp. M361]